MAVKLPVPTLWKTLWIRWGERRVSLWTRLSRSVDGALGFAPRDRLTCAIVVNGLLMQDFFGPCRVPFTLWEPRRSRTRHRASKCAGAGGGCEP
jgi:hypothetical protein